MISVQTIVAGFLLVVKAKDLVRRQSKEITMKTRYFLAGALLSILLAGCATIRGSEDVDQGRQAMLEGRYQRALGLFEDAADVDPKYVYGTELRGGVLDYSERTPSFPVNYTKPHPPLYKT